MLLYTKSHAGHKMHISVRLPWRVNQSRAWRRKEGDEEEEEEEKK
jgi:hypothetical protein